MSEVNFISIYQEKGSKHSQSYKEFNFFKERKYKYTKQVNGDIITQWLLKE